MERELMNPTDAELIAQVLAGQSAAFDEVAARHRAPLLRFLTIAVADADEAESLTQETLTRAFAQLADFRQEMPFRGWLLGIARNLVRNHFRALRVHARLISPEQCGEVAAAEGRRRGVLSGILKSETQTQLLVAVERLPAPFREAFVLHFVEGLDYAEISRRTGVAAGTLRVRAHRARGLLRTDLGPVVDTWLLEGPSGQEP